MKTFFCLQIYNGKGHAIAVFNVVEKSWCFDLMSLTEDQISFDQVKHSRDLEIQARSLSKKHYGEVMWSKLISVK